MLYLYHYKAGGGMSYQHIKKKRNGDRDRNKLNHKPKCQYDGRERHYYRKY